MRYYLAAVELAGDGTYCMVFPDLPGCTSAADTLDECVSMATEAAEGWVESMLDAGQRIPRPRELSAVKADPDMADFDTFIVVPVRVREPAVRVTFTIDPGLLQRIDTEASRRGFNRSAFLAEGARALLGEGRHNR
ncbi:MAG: hypothetical protein AMXMBFR64_56840 [Myxococcales bacterium]